MTMETYQWERKHRTSPPATLSIMRTLPDGNWTVRSDDWTLPAEFATRYDTLDAARAAADKIVGERSPHDCSQQGCGDWMPVPPGPSRT